MIRDTIEAIKRLIMRRRTAYQHTFAVDNQLALIVLKDLAKFCRAHETTFHNDPRRHALLEGRREVFMRIEQYLQLTTDEIYELHKVKDMTRGDS